MNLELNGPADAVGLRDTWRSAAVAGGAAFILALGGFIWRMAPGIAAAYTQGSLGESSYPAGTPFPVAALSRLATAIAPEHALLLGNVMAAVWAAVACGMVAVLGARVAAQVLPGFWAAAWGVCAGLLAAASEPVVLAGTAAGGASFTMALSMAAVWLMAEAMMAPPGKVMVCAIAFLAGLGAGMHPALLWLGALALAQVAVVRRLAIRRGLAVSLSGACLGAGVLVSLAGAGLTGQPAEGILAVFLAGPFPSVNPGASMPEALAYLGGAGAWPLLVLVVLHALALTTVVAPSPIRPAAVVAGVVWLLFGPLLPMLTRSGGLAVLPELRLAPQALGELALWLTAGWGAVLACVRAAELRTADLKMASASAIALTAALAAALHAGAPARKHELPARLAAYVLESAPADALLISGDARLTSALWALQRSQQTRPDVTVYPLTWLEYPALAPWSGARSGPAGANSADAAVDAHAAERWEREQPLILSRLQGSGANPQALREASRDLAVWDFVRANFHRRPISFAGVSSMWLAPRGLVHGPVIIYPRNEGAEAAPFDEWAAETLATEPLPNDPAFREMFVAVAAPLSQAARAQTDLSRAQNIAWAASEVLPDAWLTQQEVLRSAIRAGDGAPIEAMLQTPSLRPGVGGAEALRSAVVEDQYRSELEARCRAFTAAPLAPGNEWRAELREFTSELWNHDELVLLVRTYTRVLESHPEDVNTLYQLAAAHAQLGDLARAQEALSRAFKVAPAPVYERLRQDSRFILLTLSEERKLGTILDRIQYQTGWGGNLV